MSGCRICRSAIEPFIDFGRMPLANGFLTPGSVCRRILLQPERGRLSSLHPGAAGRATVARADVQRPLSVLLRQLGAHGSAFCRAGRRRHRAAAEREILRGRNRQQRRHAVAARRHSAGFVISASSRQPAWREAAIARGVNTLCRFFDAALARDDRRRSTAARDAVIAANALSHIADLHAVVEGIKVLLAARTARV